MYLAVIVAIVLCLSMVAFAFVTLKGFSFNARKLARIALVSALCIILYSIKLVPFPQGGGCSLLSILPLMLYACIFGKEEALMSAIIIAFLKIIIAPPLFILQLPLDYFGAMMAISITPIFGTESKGKLALGAIVAVVLSTLFSICSGVIFFGQFAPEGMGVWAYATGYNLLGFGVEAGLSVLILLILPIKSIGSIIKRSEKIA